MAVYDNVADKKLIVPDRLFKRQKQAIGQGRWTLARSGVIDTMTNGRWRSLVPNHSHRKQFDWRPDMSSFIRKRMEEEVTQLLLSHKHYILPLMDVKLHEGYDMVLDWEAASLLISADVCVLSMSQLIPKHESLLQELNLQIGAAHAIIRCTNTITLQSALWKLYLYNSD